MPKPRTMPLAAIIGVAVVSIPLVSYAAPKDLVELANMLANMFNSGATFLVLLAFILLFWNIVAQIMKRNGLWGEGTGYSRTIMVGIAARFVLVSIWGSIRLLQGTLFVNTNSSSGAAGGTSAPLEFPR